MYCTNDFFYFVCFIESTYLANLTIKMIRAYADGDTVDKIKTSLIGNEVVVGKITLLCGNDNCKSFTDKDKQEVVEYMMERYANMRGIFCQTLER